MPQEAMDLILYGTGEDDIVLKYVDSNNRYREYHNPWEGVVPNFERRYQETTSNYMRTEIERYMKVMPCPDCGGARLKPESLAVTLLGEAGEKNIYQVSEMTILEAKNFFEHLVLTEREQKIAKLILKEIHCLLYTSPPMVLCC